jgi:hypothetical protein
LLHHTVKGRVLPVVLGAAVVVGCANLASYAADGHGFRLGARNHEAHATTVTNDGDGPAFRFNTSHQTSPFTVSSGVRVAHLNATRVDGLKAGELSRSYRYVLPVTQSSGVVAYTADGLPSGHYNVAFDVAIAEDNPPPTGTAAAMCFVADSRHQFAVVAAGLDLGGATVVNGTGPVSVDKAGQAAFLCEAPGGFTSPVGNQFRNTLTFTLVRSVHQGKPSPVAAPVIKRAAKAWRGR